jgi:phage gpG-like protein
VAALAKLQRTVDELARMPRKLAVAVAPDVTAMLQSQFDVGVDPYGGRWRPLRPATLAKGRRNPPLTETRKLKGGTKARTLDGNRAGLWLVVGAAYGAFHQVGFRVGRTRVGPRAILPPHGIPAAWRELFRQRARELAQKAGR